MSGKSLVRDGWFVDRFFPPNLSISSDIDCNKLKVFSMHSFGMYQIKHRWNIGPAKLLPQAKILFMHFALFDPIFWPKRHFWWLQRYLVDKTQLKYRVYNNFESCLPSFFEKPFNRYEICAFFVILTQFLAQKGTSGGLIGNQTIKHNRNIGSTIILRGQPTCCDKRFRRYGIGWFCTILVLFWPKKDTSGHFQPCGRFFLDSTPNFA